MTIISAKEAADLIEESDSILLGGFLGCGAPHRCIDAIVQKGTKNLTVITNDTAKEGCGSGKLIVAKQIKKLIASHIGTNKETGRQMANGELEVILTPQGTLAEKIRAGGYGLGGILVATGLGTMIAEGKEIIDVDGKQYLLEKPIRARVALLYATYADRYGNLSYEGTTRNFNVVMSMAADVVIVEVEKMLDRVLNPNEIIVPGVVVDYIVEEQ